MLLRDPDAADVRLPPPLVYLAAVAVGVALQLLVHPIHVPLSMPARIAAAALAGGAGALLVGTAIAAFRRTGQDPKPWKTTPEFLATGVYRLTRNPMYTGLALVQACIGFALANGWILALIPGVLCVVHVTAILPEEAYLERKFGESYRAYKSTVRRWL